MSVPPPAKETAGLIGKETFSMFHIWCQVLEMLILNTETQYLSKKGKNHILCSDN